jgi:hypothetical protein
MDKSGYSMGAIAAASRGRSASGGGLNMGPIHEVLRKNDRDTSGCRSELEQELRELIAAGNGDLPRAPREGEPRIMKTGRYSKWAIEAASRGYSASGGGLNIDPSIMEVLRLNDRDTSGCRSELNQELRELLADDRAARNNATRDQVNDEQQTAAPRAQADAQENLQEGSPYKLIDTNAAGNDTDIFDLMCTSPEDRALINLDPYKAMELEFMTKSRDDEEPDECGNTWNMCKDKHGKSTPKDMLGSDLARFNYVVGTAKRALQPNTVADPAGGERYNVRDDGHDGWTLAKFMDMRVVHHAGLTLAEFVATRLYTSNSYGRINGPLRKGCTKNKPHPFPATTSLLFTALGKLRSSHCGCRRRKGPVPTGKTTYQHIMGRYGKPAPRKTFRGIKDHYMPLTGGSECAFASTSTEKAVAEGWCKGGAPALIIEFDASNVKDRGVDLSHISMYPQEKEILYPPLTAHRDTVVKIAPDGVTHVATVQVQFPQK